MAPNKLTMKLSKHLCPECSTCAMFLSSSFTVSMMALFLSKSLSETLIKSSFHVTFQFGNKLYSIHKQPLEEILADVPLVANRLAIYEIYKRFAFRWLAVVNISRRYHKVEKFSFLIANQMQFETEEPTHRTFSSLGYAFENFVNMYSLVLTDTQWCAVNEAYARAFAQEDLLDKQG